MPTGIVVSDLIRGRPIWFGGEDRSEVRMNAFYEWALSQEGKRLQAGGHGRVEALP